MNTRSKTRLISWLLWAGVTACSSNPEFVNNNATDASAGGGGGSGASGSGGLIIHADGSAAGSGGGSACGDACAPPLDAGPLCGNGVVESGEACDDGNNKQGDGCTGACQLQDNYTCPTPGQPWFSPWIRGDSKISDNEACDDVNKIPGDGCSQSCQGELGFTCGVPGQACTRSENPVCGDGQIASAWSVRRWRRARGDGCSADCKKVEAGWTCPTPAVACLDYDYCGDGKKKGPKSATTGTRSRRRLHRRCKLEPDYRVPGRRGGPAVDDRLRRRQGQWRRGLRRRQHRCSRRLLGRLQAESNRATPAPRRTASAGPCTSVPQHTCGDAG